MGSIQTITASNLSLQGEQITQSLNESHHLKTLDIGLDGNTVSTNPFGDILQLSCFHPLHGMVVACPFAQFDGDRFYDSEYVREYRKKLLDYVRSQRRGFGIQFKGTISDLQFGMEANKITITYCLDQIQIATTVYVSKQRGVVQATVLKSNSQNSIEVDYDLELNLSVNRASYGQLTEGGPIPIPLPSNQFQLLDGSQTWAVVNRNLDAIITGDLHCDGASVPMKSMKDSKTTPEQPVNIVYHGALKLAPGQTRTLVSTYKLRPGTSLQEISSTHKYLEPDRPESWKIKNQNMSLIIRGNLSYILGNCTFPVSDGTTCLITDHVALPLGWNRDNYWQIRYLLDIFLNINKLTDASTANYYRKKIEDVVRGHLNWVFRLAQRPHGYWHRSYLTTGVPKDGPVFQQDQQCYPILELCDFFDSFPSEVAFLTSILSEETIPSILSILESRQDPTTGLFATEETPGDDAVEYPYHFSSHVLLWHTLSRLASTLNKLNFSSPTLSSVILKQKADQIRTTTLRHFIAKNPTTEEVMFAYLTNGEGVHTFYHDANDLPTLFIPTWNFAINGSEEHRLWNVTMKSGLSAENKEGYFPDGPYGGLGSVHTRGPWPLGFAQEFIYANIKTDKEGIESAWRRIQGSMFMDGLFSEAVNAETGECMSKAWFSWPGSVIGCALLKFGIPT